MSQPRSEAQLKRRISLVAGWIVPPLVFLGFFVFGGAGPMTQRLVWGVAICLVWIFIQVVLVMKRR